MVSYHDPFVPVLAYADLNMTSVGALDTAPTEADCTLVATDHLGYDWNEARRKADVLVDTRNAAAREKA